MTIEIFENATCLIDGHKYPAVGFGTYPLKEEICAQAVFQAVTLGYRILDTATFYDNFESIAHALKPFERTDFYIISKAWHDSHTAKGLQEDIKKTLKLLQTTYLDAYLLHWPNSKVPIEETLQTMQTLRSQGLIRHIGMSNITINHLKRALEMKIPLTWVQVEMHPHFYDAKLLDFCKENSLTVQAWRPLDLGRMRDDTMLLELGKKYGKAACQIALKWIVQHGCMPLPGSKNEKHMKQNLDIGDFLLSKEDMQKIDQRAGNGSRVRIGKNDGLGLVDEFDFSYEECWPHSLN